MHIEEYKSTDKKAGSLFFIEIGLFTADAYFEYCYMSREKAEKQMELLKKQRHNPKCFNWSFKLHRAHCKVVE